MMTTSALFLAALVLAPSDTEVVIAPRAPKSVAFAAEEATNFLSQAFGASVPLVNSPTDGKKHLFLGTNEWSVAAGVDISGLATDGYIVAAKGDGVFIAGEDDPKIDPAGRIAHPWWQSHKFAHGTLNGVYGFLEDFASVRFYFPGELGTCVRRVERIEVAEGTRRIEPDMSIRTWSYYADGDWFEGTNRSRACHPAKALNVLRLRASTVDYRCCHGLNGFRYVERFGKTHPEYFALDRNGKRMIEGNGWSRGHLCFSSGIREEIYRDCLSYCRGEDASVRGIENIYRRGTFGWNVNTTPLNIDLMPQDGGTECFCEKCQAAKRKDGRAAPMTELVWGLLAEVAGRLAKDGYVPTFTMMSYSDYADLPDCPLPKNLKVMVARPGPWANVLPGQIAKDKDYLARWRERLGEKTWIWTYPNRDACNGLNLFDVPAWAPRAWATYYQGVSENIFGYFAESETSRSVDNLMGYYLLSKIGWNRTVDTGAVLEEFYGRMFGPAADDMRRALEFVEDKFTKEVAGAMRMTDTGPVANVPGEHELWTRIYSESETARLRSYFDSAAAKAAPGGIEARRIAFFREWMLNPLEKAGNAYRNDADVAAALEYHRAHAAANLVDEPGWLITKGVAARDAETRVCNETSLRVDTPDGKSQWALFNKLLKDVTLEPGATYRLSWFMKVDLVPNERGGGAAMGVYASVGEQTYDWTFPDTCNYLSGRTGWTHRSVEFKVPDDAPAGLKGIVRPFVRYAAGHTWFDGVLLERK